MDDTHDAIKKLAYRLWEDRGRPIGSPEVDWCRAEKELDQARRAWDLSETTHESESQSITKGSGYSYTTGEGEAHHTSTSKGTGVTKTPSKTTITGR
jgi:hypothetical protein